MADDWTAIIIADSGYRVPECEKPFQFRSRRFNSAPNGRRDLHRVTRNYRTRLYELGKTGDKIGVALNKFPDVIRRREQM